MIEAGSLNAKSALQGVRSWSRLCKNAKKIVEQKIDLSEPPIRDILKVGRGHPTHEKFKFLRFYTVCAKSGRSPCGQVDLSAGITTCSQIVQI